ncbi:hypothetical protein PR202_ga06015 [Eleusine coracana subsp. coracana]|uniref:Uncharacterized protein n=1 Tax=Eleusine coracana subsp. coracana TaxID=191504 RepID=A0AAV5BVI7_ELECO|nr:hypothetical protein PR202_ga06015 [Eleusine coracana subsp. coracana]
MQAAKLSADLASLQTDITEVEKRYSRRTGFSLADIDVLQSSSASSGAAANAFQGALLSGLVPSLCKSSIYEERVMKNMEQLENAYYSMSYGMQALVKDSRSLQSTEKELGLYVRFLDPETLISASTDNTLKIWDLNRTNSSGLSADSCSLTLSGHTNEKNFVGLSVHDGYITCGSETNEVKHQASTIPSGCPQQL